MSRPTSRPTGQPTRGLFPVEVRPAVTPEGQTWVLLQLPDGFALVSPDDARLVALQLWDAAGEIDNAEGKERPEDLL